jgi:hypothetical protein
MMPFLARDEMLEVLNARAAQLESEIVGLSFQRQGIKDGATGADGAIPEHVREILDFLSARKRGELEWTKQLQGRIKDGAYRFETEWEDSQA